MAKSDYEINPELDLVIERVIDVKPSNVWAAWTNAELLNQWFTPKPWSCRCDIDVRPGGDFGLIMISPEGEETESHGCYLEIIENRKLVWTSALLPGYRPLSDSREDKSFLFTAIIDIEPHPSGTQYTIIAKHSDKEGCKVHDELGFYGGWGTALDQMIELIKG